MNRIQGAWSTVDVAVCILAWTAALVSQRGVASPPATNQAQQTPSPTPAVGTAAISGVVIDGVTGRPVGGAFVSIGAERVPGSLPTSSRLATDGQGRFVFSRLPAGNYQMSAAKLGYFTSRFGQPDPGGTPSAPPTRLTEGQWFADAKIILWPPSAISGTITDEAGEPVVGTFVRVFAQVMIGGRPQLATGASAKTDDRGRYRVSSLLKGRYVVVVPSVQTAVPADVTVPIALTDDPAIGVDASNRLIVGRFVTPPPPTSDGWVYPLMFLPAARTIADAIPIDLAAGEQRQNIDLQLAPVRSVRISGVVQGPVGSTPGGMTLRLLPAGSETLGYGSETATALVAPTGTFTLLNVPAGAYTIVVSRSTMEYTTGPAVSNGSVPTPSVTMPRPPGVGASSSGMGTVGNTGSSTQYVFNHGQGNREYSARMPIAVGDQHLAGIVVPLNRGVTLSGRIVWAGGVPPPGVATLRLGQTILAEPAGGDPLLGLPSGSSSSGEVERFRIDGLLAGAYTLRLSATDARVKSIEWQGRDYADRPFDTSRGSDIEDVVVTLTTEVAKLTGIVRDATGQPATSAAIIVFPTDRSRWRDYGLRPSRIVSSPVTAAGAFTINSLPAGEYFVVAVSPSMADDWQDPRFLEAASASAPKVTLAWGEAKAVDVRVSTIRVR